MEKPEHPKMQGKSNEEVLAEAKPLVDEIKGFATDENFVLYVGAKTYSGKELCNEVLNLSPFGRGYISSWHYANERINEWTRKRLIPLEKSLRKRAWFVAISIVLMAITIVLVSPRLWSGRLIILGSICMAIFAIVFFTKKAKEVDKRKALLRY